MQLGLVVELIEPGLDRLHPPVRGNAHGDRAEDSGGAVLVAGPVRVVERRLGVSLGFEPVRCALVERRNQLRLALLQLPLEQVAEEVVVAIGAPVPVERHHEEVRRLERRQLESRFLPLQDGIAERAGHRLEHRRAAKERQLLRREP